MWMRSVSAAVTEIYGINRNIILRLKKRVLVRNHPNIRLYSHHFHSVPCGTKLIRCNYNGIKKWTYASYSASTSQRRIQRTREILALLVIGVTGGVVYGLSKKYENDKFDEKIDEINKIIKRAETIYIQEKKKEMSVKYYKEALQLVKIQIDSEQSQRRMSILTTKYVFIIDQLANLMHGLGRLDEAEDYYKQTLRSLLAHHTRQDDDAVIEISLKLASIYAEQKRHNLAENGYTWCVDIARKKVKDAQKLHQNSAALLGVCLESFGKYALSRNQFSKAISLFSEALEISRNIFANDHLQVLLLLNNLGVAYFEAGDVDTSITYFNQAIKRSDGKIYDDIWSFHFNLADVLAQSGNIEEAKVQYEKSLELCHDEDIKHNIRDKISKVS